MHCIIPAIPLSGVFIVRGETQSLHLLGEESAHECMAAAA